MSILKRFCPAGHDKLIVGTYRGFCRTCKRVQRNADSRRRYLRDPEKSYARTRKYHVDHPEWSARKKRESYLRLRGANFWVQQDKESV